MVNPTTAERVAQSVAQAMVTAGVNKRQLSEATGIPYTTLGRKILGATEFNFSELLAIAEFLRVPPRRFTPTEFRAAHQHEDSAPALAATSKAAA